MLIKKQLIINKVISYYLWLLPIIFIFYLFRVGRNDALLYSMAGLVFILTLLILIIFWIVFKRINNIKGEFWQDRNLFGRAIERYSRMILVVYFLLVIPIGLCLTYLLEKNVAFLFYWLMIFLSIAAPFICLVYLPSGLYNLIFNIKNIKKKKFWINLGILVLSIILFLLYVDQSMAILNRIYETFH